MGQLVPNDSTFAHSHSGGKDYASNKHTHASKGKRRSESNDIFSGERLERGSLFSDPSQLVDEGSDKSETRSHGLKSCLSSKPKYSTSSASDKQSDCSQ